MADIRNTYTNFGRYSADLCLFLLVAQHQQLSMAAKASGLSQPRVSQRMRALEDSLGQSLFLRERRGVRLTREGRALHAALLSPLTEAAGAFAAFQNRARRNQVVILSDSAFASFLLLPEFASLTAAFEEIGISLLTAQQPDARFYPDADIMIRMAPTADVGDTDALLFRERVSAVCSPEFLDRTPGIATAQDLTGLKMIELASGTDAPWFTWDDWMRAALGSPFTARNTVAFNSYDHVISAAKSGLGLALGWEGLLKVDEPGSGLVRAVPNQIESKHGYVLSLLTERQSPASAAVFDWLKATFTMSPVPA
ncbi:LysR family transcriptional regulator [Cognatishimia maritima]|uniref:DNA-binding transcriptional regulator, LysR family n=1 Tax=Cognatishimia maritima TaxID=870908 RepID=A0A1M5L9P3_9RHOB|nr:LysR family transcriptional regulator [Cognatishimia maritima]SHG61737.1 DNA-binding transcriptional regulator, LysR family [Cognatishimia maritima]